MMAPSEFRAAVDAFCLEFSLSVRSGRRTDAYSIQVGGFAGDPHSWGAGVDTVPVEIDPYRQTELKARANELGLVVLWEHGSQHLQPEGWPAGVVAHAPDDSWEGQHA